MSRLLVNSLPKSGTNLLQRCVELLGLKYSNKSISSANILGNFYFLRVLFRGPLFDRRQVIVGLDVKVSLSQSWLEKRLSRVKEGEYISAHLNYSEHLYRLLRKHRYKIITILRDPRDVIISHIYYAKKESKHLFHALYKNLSFDEALNVTLSGGFFNGLYMYSFKSILKDMIGWISISKYDSNVLIVRFEDLVGKEGGGSEERQINAILNISKFIFGRNELCVPLDSVISNLFGKSHTFRKGKIGSWRSELSSDQIRRIESNIGDYIVSLGYDLYGE